MAVAHHSKSWTYEDLLALPDDGKRYEIIDGVLYEMTGPKPPHALVLIATLDLLEEPVRAAGGLRLTAPIDVFFAGADPVQPDLLVLLPGGTARISERGIEGPPDLVVEVLSPSNRDHDIYTKRALYGRGGVREYWIVDPEARTVEVLALVGDALQTRGRYAGEQVVASTLLPETFSAAAVFAALDAIRPAPDQG